MIATKRWVRRKDAADYLGVDEEWFDRNIRPSIAEIHTGTGRTSPIYFDLKDIDAYMESKKIHK